MKYLDIIQMPTHHLVRAKRHYFPNLSVIVMLGAFLLNICPVVHSSDQPFQKGEIINYNIEKFKVKIGEATLAFNGLVEVQGKEALSITFTARGFKFFDEEQIYVDAQTFFPLLIKRNLDMFGKEERITEYYDAQKGKVHIVKRAKGGTTEQIIENGGRFDNIYGFIYRHRQSGRFEKDKALDIHLPTNDLRFQFVKRKSISIHGQKFDADYIESAPNQYELWFDSGPRRIPLKIDGTLGFGNMKMVFKDLSLKDE
jgi:hypothetical protein